DGVIVFSFPLVLLALWQMGGIDTLAVRSYLALCLAITFLAIPVFTAWRLIRPAAPQLVQRRSDVVDYARELGRKPAGDFKYRRLALLPGNQVYQVEFVELTLKM